MLRHTFIYTGGLATVAVLGLGAASPASASAAACGHPATYVTVVVPAVTQTVPAVTRVESLWSREVTTTRREAARTTPGYDVVRWSRTSEQRELEYSEKVIDQEYVPATAEIPAVWRTDTVVIPAVTMTLFEYAQLVDPTHTRWEEEGWNAGPKGKGWSPTGLTDLVVIEPERTESVQVLVSAAVPGTPEVPETSHLEYSWLPEGDTPAAGQTATGSSRLVPGGSETVDLPEGETPAGAGWALGAVVDTVAALVETIWLSEGDSMPAGFVETGVVDVDSSVETTSSKGADAPAGDGWARVAGTEETVEVAPEEVVVITPETTTQVLVTPADDSGCAPETETPETETPVTETPVTETPETESPVTESPVTTSPVTVTGETTSPVRVSPAAASPETTSPAALAGALPATGSPVSPGLLAAGLTSLVAGVVLVRRSRRTSA